MSILDILRSGDGAAALDQLARANGLTSEQVQAIAARVVPAFSDQIERITLSRGGIADILTELMHPGHATILGDPSQALSPQAVATGTGALSTILGNRDQSRSVAAQAAASTGVSQTLIEKLLPVLASLVMAALAKQTQGGLGDILKRLPNVGAPADAPPQRRSATAADRQQDDAQDTGPEGGPIARSTTASAPSTTSMGSGSPLPLPGDLIPGINAPARPGSMAPSPDPYGKLPDILRDSRQTVDGTPLGSMVRDVFGSALGFQSKGFMSWALRLIVMRWGWGLAQRLLATVMARR